MVRITVDTAQDDASTIRSIITLLNQELAKKGSRPETPRLDADYGAAAQPSSGHSSSQPDSTSAGGAFQHQDTSDLMNMFSDDLPSTNPKTLEKHRSSRQNSSQNTWEDSGSFLFGNVEDVAGNEKPSSAQVSEGTSDPEVSHQRPRSFEEDDDDDFNVTEYH